MSEGPSGRTMPQPAIARPSLETVLHWGTRKAKCVGKMTVGDQPEPRFLPARGANGTKAEGPVT